MDSLSLPPLPYALSALEPVISEQQLKIHYEKHHRSYIDNANEILRKGIQTENVRELTFNIAGHILHTTFWQTMAPEGKGGEIYPPLSQALEKDFGGVEEFRNSFSNIALSVQGSGWAALSYDQLTNKLLLTQIEKHQDNLYPTLPIIMVLDVWEHAYYLDYQNKRKDYVENWWRIVNWQGIADRFGKITGIC